MLSFNGDFKKSRDINLGGSRQKTKSGRIDVLRQSREARAARQLHRNQERSALYLQSLWRSKIVRRQHANEIANQWDNDVASIINDHNDILGTTTKISHEFLISMMSRLVYMCRWHKQDIRTMRQRMAKLLLIIFHFNSSDLICEENSEFISYRRLVNLIVKICLRLLKEWFVSSPVLLDMKVNDDDDGGGGNEGEVAFHIELFLRMIVKYTTPYVAGNPLEFNLRILMYCLQDDTYYTGLVSLLCSQHFKDNPKLSQLLSDALLAPFASNCSADICNAALKPFIAYVLSVPVIMDKFHRDTIDVFFKSLPIEKIILSLSNEGIFDFCDVKGTCEKEECLVALLGNLIELGNLCFHSISNVTVDSFNYVLVTLIEAIPEGLLFSPTSSRSQAIMAVEDDSSDDEDTEMDEIVVRHKAWIKRHPVTRNKELQKQLSLLTNSMLSNLSDATFNSKGGDVCCFERTSIQRFAELTSSLLAHWPLKRLSILNALAFQPRFCTAIWALLQEPQHDPSQSLLGRMAAQFNGCSVTPLSLSDEALMQPSLLLACECLCHALVTMDDTEFYEDNTFAGGVLSTTNRASLVSLLRDIGVGMLLSAPADRLDGKHAVQSSKSGGLINAICCLLGQLHSRHVRRPFCSPYHWLIHGSIAELINVDYVSVNSLLRNDAVNELPTMTVTSSPNDGNVSALPSNLPTPNIQVEQLLRAAPYTIPFETRVRLFRRLIVADRESVGATHFGVGHRIIASVRRGYVYEDGFDQLFEVNGKRLKNRVQILFRNEYGLDEAGIDGGGVFKEFMTELVKTAFDPQRGLFRMTSAQQLYPNPDVQLYHERPLDHFAFLGRILGKALYDGVLVELPLAPFFLSKLLGKTNGINDLPSLDPDVFKNLLFLKRYEGDMEDLSLSFTIVRQDLAGHARVRELIPGGADVAVTRENRLKYVYLMAHYYLNVQILKQAEAFLDGMAEVVQLQWLRLFDVAELQTLISGAEIPIDIDDLRRHTHYLGGYSESHPTIQLFWYVVNELSNDERQRLVKFTTSCSRQPLLGFGELHPSFAIHAGGDDEERLPTASTCMNLLKLPRYTTLDQMRTKLLYSINDAAGFELS